MKKNAPPNYLFMSLVTLLARDFWILRFYGNRGYTNTTLRPNWTWDGVSSHLFSCLFSQTQTSADTKKKRKSKIALFHHRTSLMKLAIGILILDRPPNLAISWPCFKRMVILSITTYLIPYNYFLPFFSLMGTVAIKWTNSSEKFSINLSI